MGYPVGAGVQNPKKVVHDFVEFSTSINYMVKWVTPLGVR